MTLPFSTLVSNTPKPAQVQTMQDVWDWILSHAPDPAEPKKGNPHGFRLQYLTTLKRHCGDAPLCTIPADLEAFDKDFPKAKKNVHPRPDLDQDLKAYKKWRQNCRKAVEITTGAAVEKAELRARQDGWSDLLGAVITHIKNGGGIHPAATAHVVHLSDIGRRIGIEPWELNDGDILNRLEAGFVTPSDLQNARKAQKFLNSYRYIPEIAAVLPTATLPVFPTYRQYQSLADHIEVYLLELIKRAAGKVDEVMGNDDHKPISEKNQDGMAVGSASSRQDLGEMSCLSRSKLQSPDH